MVEKMENEKEQTSHLMCTLGPAPHRSIVQEYGSAAAPLQFFHFIFFSILVTIFPVTILPRYV